MSFKWYDALIILSIIVLCGLLSFFIYRGNKEQENSYNDKVKTMIVLKDNVEVYRLDLTSIDGIREIEIMGDLTPMVIGADKDGCWIISSGCYDQVCVRHGKIIDSEDIPIICAPNKVQISIVYEPKKD